MTKRVTPGFTLIELLTVVAVIAVLAAIAVPNFLEAQVRAKVARTHADMAAVSSALRSYYADHNRYPANNPHLRRFLQAAVHVEQPDALSLPTPPDEPVSWTSDDPDRTMRPGLASLGYPEWERIIRRGHSFRYPILPTSGHDLRVLTTPVAYCGRSLPLDPFHDNRDMPFTYVNLADLQTTAGETGPGGRLRRYVLLSYGPDNDSSRPRFNPARGPFLPYDPTNGTVSHGEIVLFGDHSTHARPDDLKPVMPPSSQPADPFGGW